ncbi:hypothetical protein NC651_018936 [Populus alba x Populus x berolinensis]|nr:hypothetical protein NC651_018936 [Populus alba x Populus x berolinensis]
MDTNESEAYPALLDIAYLIHPVVRFSNFNSSPLVYCKPHRPLEHVNLCVTQDDSGTRLHHVSCIGSNSLLEHMKKH